MEQMQVLGIDYGLKKIGLAVSEKLLSQPLGVVRIKDVDDALVKITQKAKTEKVDLIVIGISEGKMAKQTKLFASKLKKLVKVPVKFQDETLSTRDSLVLSIQAKISRKKRRSMEDAYAASIMLQSYLDSHV